MANALVYIHVVAHVNIGPPLNGVLLKNILLLQFILMKIQLQAMPINKL
jgi:hypothetical protein